MSIQIKILYFAGVKDITQKEFEHVTIPTATTLATLSDILVNTYGDKLKEILSVSMYAIDMEYVEKDQKSITVIQDGSEIAIIPPVSGG